MWQIYQCSLLCVTCTIFSFLFLPTSVTLAVVCVCLALLFMLNDYLLWRYFSIHVASIYYWIINIYNFLTNMYHQSNITNGPARKYIDSSGTSANNIGLYRKNKPNPKYNLISSYSLQSASGISKSFQSPLNSLPHRPSVESPLAESSQGENSSNFELFVGNISRSNIPVNKSSPRLNSPKYQTLSPIASRRMESQNEAGLLTPSTRFNTNLSPKLYADINSPGFCGRVAEKLNESMTHQAKYSKVGAFPIVNLKNRLSKPHLSHRNSQAVAKSPVRVRIAPPDMSLSSLDNSILRHTSIGSDESMKSVLQVLREISRKRIHSQENEEVDDNTKRLRKSELEDVVMEEHNSTEQLAQGKRAREDSPRNEEVKRQRRQFRNNEILSSLSSSMTIQPPHLEQPKKRKAQHGDEVPTLDSSKGKVLKVQSSPSPQTTTKQEENVIVEKKKTEDMVQETSQQPIIETPNAKKVVLSRIPSPTQAKTLTTTDETENNESTSPRLFGRFVTPNKSGGMDGDNENEQDGKRWSKLTASPPQEQADRFLDMLSLLVEDDEDDEEDIDDIPILAELFETKSINLSNTLAKASPSILNFSSPSEKKSVSFSDPIAVTKVISDSDSGSTSELSDKEKLESSAFKTTGSFVTPNKNIEGTKESGGSSLGATAEFKTSNSSGFDLNKTEQKQSYSTPASILSASVPTTSSEISKPSVNLSPAISAPPKSIFSFNSSSSANDAFKSSPSPVATSFGQAMAFPVTQSNSSNLISPFSVSSTNSSISQTESTPSISFGTVTSNPVTTSNPVMPVMFGSVTTTTATTEAPKAGFTFSSSITKKEAEKPAPSINFGTTSQSFSLPTENTMFASSSTASSVTPALENKTMFSMASTSDASAKPSFTFGSSNSNTLEPTQNKPMFGNVFGAVSSTTNTTVADKPSPFGNVFNSASTAQSNTLLSGFGSGNKTTVSATEGFATSTTTSSLFPLPTSNVAQSQNANVFDLSKTQQNSEPSNIFGGSVPNLETKTNFGTSKAATNGFAFTPAATSSSDMFGNVFGTPTPVQNQQLNTNSSISSEQGSLSSLSKFKIPKSPKPGLFSFGSTASANQNIPAFGSVAKTTTSTTPPAFTFGSNPTASTAQSNSVFGSPISSSTLQTNSPFGSASTPQTTLAFGTPTPNTTVQTTAFGINTQKSSTPFATTPNPLASSAFGMPTTNTPQSANTAFNAPAAASGFPSLTNGTASSSSTFGGFGASSTPAPFAFGGTTPNPGDFLFGGSSASNTSIGFGTTAKPVAFNAAPTQPTVNTQQNVFSFGQSPAPSPASTQLNFQFNAGSTQTSQGAFNFNSAAPSAPNAFQIGAAVAPSPTTMFTLGSSTPRPKIVPRARRK